MSSCKLGTQFGRPMEDRRTREHIGLALLIALSVLMVVAGGCAKQAVQPTTEETVAPSVSTGIEPKATDILKAASNRLASALTMKFTAVVSHEGPSLLGPTLVYAIKSDVTLQRPDKLKVITPGDGPASEFYYDGKTMVAFSPTENLIAVAEAPPKIDEALEAAYHSAAIYYPFTDLIVADPYADIADGLKDAFYIGQSIVVGGTTTDIVAYVSNDVFVQVWIGVEDKLPRRSRAIYMKDPYQLRHQMDLSNWEIDPAIPADAFTAPNPEGVRRIPFAHPESWVPPGAKPGTEEPSKPK